MQRNRYYEKPLRKRKFFKQDSDQRIYDEEENQESDNEYVTDFRKHKKLRKRIVYVDEIDGDDEQSEPEIEPEINEKELKKTLKKNKKKNLKTLKQEYEINKDVTFLFKLIYVFFLINTRCKNLYWIKFIYGRP